MVKLTPVNLAITATRLHYFQKETKFVAGISNFDLSAFPNFRDRVNLTFKVIHKNSRKQARCISNHLVTVMLTTYLTLKVSYKVHRLCNHLIIIVARKSVRHFAELYIILLKTFPSLPQNISNIDSMSQRCLSFENENDLSKNRPTHPQNSLASQSKDF